MKRKEIYVKNKLVKGKQQGYNYNTKLNYGRKREEYKGEGLAEQHQFGQGHRGGNISSAKLNKPVCGGKPEEGPN